MMRWFLEWLKGGADGPPRSPERVRASLVEERRRLAEILATFREFGFEAEAQGCKAHLRRVQSEIRDLDCKPGHSPQEPGVGTP